MIQDEPLLAERRHVERPQVGAADRALHQRTEPGERELRLHLGDVRPVRLEERLAGDGVYLEVDDAVEAYLRRDNESPDV